MVRSTSSAKMMNTEAYSHHERFYGSLVHFGVYVALLVALVWLSFLVTNSRREVAVSRYDYLVVGSLLLGVGFFTLQELMKVVYSVERNCPTSCDRARVWVPLIVHLSIVGLAIYYLVKTYQDTTDDSVFDLTGDVNATTNEVYGTAVFAMIIVLLALLWRILYVWMGF